MLTSFSFAEDVKNGLTASRKSLPPKYFYDEKGSGLFEKICATPEYYVTRTETEILRKYSPEIASANSGKKIMVELGSGSSVKTRYLLDSFITGNGYFKYVPIDVSDILISGSEQLLERYELLNIDAIQAEYEQGIEIAGQVSMEPKILIFLGSSIGNFDLHESEALVRGIASQMNSDDSFLIGFDMVKDEDVLNAAYNDAAGVTADFNLNLLYRINSELNGEFDISKFDHRAFFNGKESRIEMHLVSLDEQDICIHGIRKEIHFDKGETIHTENSYKFTDEMIREIAEASGLKLSHKWTDSRDYFSLCLFNKG
jgi:dimethylhistidine N-methyltransferase